MTEPKRIIEVKEFECPFCGATKTIQTKDVIDYWTCHVCGSDNDILDESDFTDVKNLTEEQLLKMKDTDAINLFTFAQYLVQKKEFEKASRIMKHILS